MLVKGAVTAGRGLGPRRPDPGSSGRGRHPHRCPARRLGRPGPARLARAHLSFREISECLYLSPHTVKSQALSVYRKLGVSSRSQAIQHMRQTGLLPVEPAPE
jgi:hypothetical protein